MQDLEAVKTVLGELWPHISDDHSPSGPDGLVLRSGEFWVGVHDPDLVAAYFFRPINSTLWEGHINVRPSAWGKSDDYTHGCIKWMRENTTCQKVIGYIPVTATAVLKHVGRCGFKTHSIIAGGVMLGGEAVDLVMVEY